MTSDPLSVYRQTRIKTASQGQLIVMLYDEGLRQLKIASDELAAVKPNLEIAHNAIVRAQDINTELMVSLDFDAGGEIAQNLFHLYMYFNQTLVDANISKNVHKITEVHDLMVELREAWATIEGTVESQTKAVPNGINLAG